MLMSNVEWCPVWRILSKGEQVNTSKGDTRTQSKFTSTSTCQKLCTLRCRDDNPTMRYLHASESMIHLMKDLDNNAINMYFSFTET